MKSRCEKEAEEGDTLCPSLRDAVGEYERGIIARTMAVTAGNISEAAKIFRRAQADPSKKGKTIRNPSVNAFGKIGLPGRKA